MRKNAMMRLASVILVLTLLSTCAISGTFAKYTTSKSGSDEARVAKFGVEITANGTMFATEYATDDNTVVGAIAKSVVTSTATDADGKKLVAPGTKGEMVEMTLAGTPEVAVKVTYEGTVTLSDWEVGDTPVYYCPLEVKVGSTSYKGTSYADAAAFAKAIKDAIDGSSKEYGPNTDLSTKEADSLDITWEWDFEGNDDAKDTLLGNKGDDTIKIEVKTIVTQID